MALLTRQPFLFYKLLAIKNTASRTFDNLRRQAAARLLSGNNFSVQSGR
jgi:hypothetical protein